MKKYYYKDQLVRTSKREYGYAVIIEEEDGTISTMACSSNRELAIKEMNRILTDNSRNLNFFYKLRDARTNGDTMLWGKDGRRDVRKKVSDYDYISDSRLNEYIEDDENRMNYLKQMKVVEIEAR